jgi:hypothetical protein
VCDGSGFVIDEATNTASDCDCRAARIAGARTKSLAGRIPRRYQGVSFDRPPVSDIARTAPEQIRSVRRYVRAIETNVDTGKGLWIQGDVGTGKTTLAMLVSKAALDAGRSVAIYSLPRLLNLLRESMDSEEGMVDFMDRLTAVDLLHLDVPGIVIVGAQWGDEGKGKITDLLAEHGRRGRALPGRQQRRPHDRPRRRGVEAPPDPLGHPLPGQALRDRQRRRDRPARC